MLAPCFPLSRRERAGIRARRLANAVRRLAQRWVPVAICASAAPLLALGGGLAAGWLWDSVHPAVALLVLAIAGADALFALAAAAALATEDAR